MNFSIPIYIQHLVEPDSKQGPYRLRPLFFDHPVEHNRSLSRGLADLVKEIRRELGSLANQSSHQELVRWTYCPDLELQEVVVSVMPKKSGVPSRFPVVLMPMDKRQLVQVPSVTGIWFELNPGENLVMKTEEVLRRHFHECEREGEESAVRAGQLTGKASLTTVELEIELPVSWKPDPPSFMHLLGGRKRLSGREELEKVGHCLDWDYPDGLQRALKRDALVEEILSLWQPTDRRSLLLVGPRMAGKTAVLHECIFRRMADRSLPQKYSLAETTWQVAPQRLIAGMSYVGQWEERWLVILDWCRQHQLRLHLDDVLGLFQAGVSAESNLCLADVLKPFIERREVSILAEITPEALRRLQEKDRGFADLFQVLPVYETSELDTLLIAIAQRRELEDRHGCQFSLETIPLIIDLQRRYARDAAFPGKAVQMMKQLATVKTGQNIGRDEVLHAFQRSSGLSLNFLNDRVKLSRAEVVQGIRERLMGQNEAVTAAADVICVAKARLKETGKPLGCFLFLGPTGVGKTQCAKAMAGYLFNNPERLIRIDLNEYLGADAVGRLVGTFHQPEGILTSAIRRQPFSVVLLDEIEKANPEVLDLLLQVLGEARLTDALGRTADFSNAIVILTSNLGAAQAGRTVGFRQDRQQLALSFRQAAERFFRPEFFNRIDRVIPFGALDRVEIEDISQRLLAQLRNREGLKRWRCELRVSDAAAQAITEKGYDPQLGARALKRALERELAQPIGVHLSAMKPGNPGVIRVLVSEKQLVIQPNELVFAEPITSPRTDIQKNPRSELKKHTEIIRDCSSRLDKLAPSDPRNPARIEGRQRAYYATHEQLIRTRELTQDLLAACDQEAEAKISFAAFPSKIGRKISQKPYRWLAPGRRVAVANLLAEQAMREFIREQEKNPRADRLLDRLEQICRETAWLQTMIRAAEAGAFPRAVLIICGAGLSHPDHPKKRCLREQPKPGRSHPKPTPERQPPDAPSEETDLLRETVELCGLEGEWLNQGRLIAGPPTLMPEERFALGLVLQGPGALELAQALAGTELILEADNRLQLRQVIAFRLPPDDVPVRWVETQLARHAEWLSQWPASGPGANQENDPLAFAPITQITDHRTQVVLDLPTGLGFRQAQLRPEDLRQIALSRRVFGFSGGGE